MITEEIFRGLTGADSVHLTDWPEGDDLPADPALVASMDRVRDVCSAASSIRKAQGLRVRLPLACLTVAAPDAGELRPFIDLIKDEVNVKEVILTEDVAGAASLFLQLVPAVLGPRVGPDVQKLLRAVKAGDWRRADDGSVVVGDRTLAHDEFTLRLAVADETVSRSLPGDEGLVVLDTTPSPELESEGLARDMIRLVQRARKNAGLDVSDRIHLALAGAPDVRTAVEANRARVMEQTLALRMDFADQPSGDSVDEAELDGEPVVIAISRSG
jgi:isoleucyl-tRNA synthetase